MRIERLYRYPVKGLTAEALEEAHVQPGGALPWDRSFALAHGDAKFDPAAPEFLHKSNFMCLLRHARIARLSAGFDPHDHVLRITAPDGTRVAENPLTAAGRARIGAFLVGFLGEEARHGEAGGPVFHYVPGHVFGDQRQPAVSLLGLASLAAFQRDIGATREAIRFRANIYFSGAAPWSEFDWVDRTLQVGGAMLRVTKRTRRCDATQVNPATAERDADPVRELMRTYGHPDLGIHTEVVEGGRIAVGDTITVLP
ncbi:MAG: MOSC domain-containing protein [Acetobacteraceae bacterium]